MNDKYNHSVSDSMNSLAFNLDSLQKRYNMMIENKNYR